MADDKVPIPHLCNPVVSDVDPTLWQYRVGALSVILLVLVGLAAVIMIPLLTR